MSAQLRSVVCLLVVRDAQGEEKVAEVVDVKVKQDAKVIELLKAVYDHLQSKNDGNKVFKVEKVAKSLVGEPISNFNCLVATQFSTF